MRLKKSKIAAFDHPKSNNSQDFLLGQSPQKEGTHKILRIYNFPVWQQSNNFERKKKQERKPDRHDELHPIAIAFVFHSSC